MESTRLKTQRPDIIDLAIARLEQKGLLGRKDWIVLVIDEMVVIRDRILKNRTQQKIATKRWKNKEVKK